MTGGISPLLGYSDGEFIDFCILNEPRIPEITPAFIYFGV